MWLFVIYCYATYILARYISGSIYLLTDITSINYETTSINYETTSNKSKSDGSIDLLDCENRHLLSSPRIK
jgi:hypothetical protein